MQSFRYLESAYAIPDAKAAAYRDAWDYLAGPGSWWTGAQRIAIAEATRAAVECPLCQQRAAALSPYTIDGEHTPAAGTSADAPLLPARFVDAVHRIRTDPARLTGPWVDSLIDHEFGYGHYVELISVIATLISIDSFHEVLGIPLEPLPAARPGFPDRYRPPGAAIDVAWVPMIYPQNLTDAEADIYFGSAQTGNVIRALSLVPEAVRKLHSVSAVQYLPTPQIMDMSASGSLSLTRPQTELVAARTSALNDCFY